MLFLLLGMELKMMSNIGSLKIHGEKTGVTMATSRWNWGRTCAVSIHKTSVLNKETPADHAPTKTKLKIRSGHGWIEFLMIQSISIFYLNNWIKFSIKIHFFKKISLDFLKSRSKFLNKDLNSVQIFGSTSKFKIHFL